MGAAIMGATMLDENYIIGIPFGTGNWWPKICMWGSQAQPLFTFLNIYHLLEAHSYIFSTSTYVRNITDTVNA